MNHTAAKQDTCAGVSLETARFRDIAYYTFNDQKQPGQPVIVHIHGAGSRGSDINIAMQANPVLRYANTAEAFPFKVYAPQCHQNTWFDIYEQLLDFLDFVQQREATAPICLTGISMGGYCSWQLLQSKPVFFRKALICCGGGMYWNAPRIKTPVKAFHGKLDQTVFCEESQKMVDAVNASGGSAELFIYDELAHNVWDAVFSDASNYKWLLDA